MFKLKLYFILQQLDRSFYFVSSTGLIQLQIFNAASVIWSVTLISRLFLMNVKATLSWVTDWLVGLKWLIHGSYPTWIAIFFFLCMLLTYETISWITHWLFIWQIFVVHATDLTSILTFLWPFFSFLRLVSIITRSLNLMVDLHRGQLSITIFWLNTMRSAGVENQSKTMTSPAMCSWRMLEKTPFSTIQKCLQVRRLFHFFAIVMVWYAN